MGNTRRARQAPPAPEPEPAEQPTPGRRSVDLNRVIHRLKLRAGEAEQEAAVLEAMLEEAEEKLAAEQEVSAALREQLVAATSARGERTSESG